MGLESVQIAAQETASQLDHPFSFITQRVKLAYRGAKFLERIGVPNLDKFTRSFNFDRKTVTFSQLELLKNELRPKASIEITVVPDSNVVSQLITKLRARFIKEKNKTELKTRNHARVLISKFLRVDTESGQQFLDIHCLLSGDKKTARLTITFGTRSTQLDVQSTSSAVLTDGEKNSMGMRFPSHLPKELQHILYQNLTSHEPIDLQDFIASLSVLPQADNPKTILPKLKRKAIRSQQTAKVPNPKTVSGD